MTDSYNVGYSVDALGDLREIYSYIANELLVPGTAAAQLGRIRKEVRSLDFMPARYTLVEWEPWHSMKMHQLPVDNFIVYYLADDKERTVTVARGGVKCQVKKKEFGVSIQRMTIYFCIRM